MIVAVGLCLRQIALLEELLDEAEQHAWVSREKVLDLVQWHVLSMARRLECPLDKVVRAGDRDKVLELREVIWIQFVVFDKLGSNLGMLRP